MEPFSFNSPGFVNLLASQSSPPIDVDSAEAAGNSPGLVKPLERRKWGPKEDLVLISAWLNTSTDPIVSNEQKAWAFWKRKEEYFNSSPQLIGSVPREWGQCKQRWGRVNEQVCKFVGCHEATLKEQASGQNENDVMKAAHGIFLNDYHVKFTLEHCWRELRFDQKWRSHSLSKDGAKEKREEAGPEVVADDEEVRPPGVKVLKQSYLLNVKNPPGKMSNGLLEYCNRVENERHGYTQIDTSEFESGESSRSSKVKRRTSIHVGNMLGIRNEVRDSEKHDRLKADLMENVLQKFGNVDE
ncbi:PREDICTED: glutathione S-transferase T3-like [Brassica oleracea var. oleracea]|uniref:glutathione S-transferase T3-like n=1 Tax=Brassica oleracea var. oleracea TaxID=109376 RepID=UPI0006A6A7EE|nr:PREDICTED: glutathione S-transferase T3-like [Brassica oleracea var. oleracea]